MGKVQSTLKELARLSVRAVALYAASALFPISAFSQTTVSTAPVGYINLTIAAGTGSVPKLSVLSFPLLGSPSITGQSTGVITAVTANTISNANAGWTAAELSGPASPYVMQITSGSAAGRIFLISTTTANTSTTVTLDSQDVSQVDLTKLGILTGASGDTYSIYPCDTLLTAFGQGSAIASGTTVLGAATSDSADIVQIVISGAWRQYYYNSASKHWMRAGPDIISDNVPIRPDAGIIYMRRAALSLSFSIMGQVPAIERQATVANHGMTCLSSLWPVDINLGNSGISSMPGWIASDSPANADMVQLSVQGAWRQYYYNGSHWLRAGPDIVSDSVNIPVGSLIMLLKSGNATGVTTLTQPLPYKL